MLRGKLDYKQTDPRRAIVRLRKLPADLDGGALAAVREMGADMKAWAQPNAPWTDRTGDARKLLDGYHGAYNAGKGKVYYAALRHGVPYGIWLEVRFNGRWGIVWRALEFFRGKAGSYMIKHLNRAVGK